MRRLNEARTKWVVTPTTVLLAFAALLMIAATQKGSAQPLNVWQTSGPNEKFYTVAPDPLDPAVVYAGGPTSSYKSNDRGTTWAPLSLGGATDFSFDLAHPGTVYAAKEGVYKSIDGGMTWVRLNAPHVTRLQVSRNDSNLVVAADTSGPFSGVAVSADAGASWVTKGFSNPFPHYSVDSFDIDPVNPQNIYVYISGEDLGGQLKTTNGGDTWENFHYEPHMIVYTSSLKVYAEDHNYVFASSFVGFYRSSDRGSTWEFRGHPGTLSTIAIDPRDRTRLFAVGGLHGIRRSLDEGASWSPFNDGLTLPIGQINDLEINEAGAFLYAATGQGIYRVSLRPSVSVSGRVTAPNGLGLRNAVVIVTDSAGNRQSTLTSSLGFYSIGDIPAGETVTISVTSRRYRFEPITRTMNENLSEVDLVGIE